MGQSHSGVEIPCRIVIIGDDLTGKTTILQSHTQLLSEGKHEVHLKKLSLDEEHTALIEIHRDVFLERYKNAKVTSARDPYTEDKIEGALVLFDTTNRESFDTAVQWCKKMRSVWEEITVFLVGTKIDLEREIGTQEGEENAEGADVEYFEINCLEEDQVNDVLRDLVGRCAMKKQEL